MRQKKCFLSVFTKTEIGEKLHKDFLPEISMTAVTGSSTQNSTQKPTVRVYVPRYVRLCCDRVSLFDRNSAHYRTERVQQMRRCCDPAADILGGIIALTGVEYVTIDNGKVEVGIWYYANVDQVDAEIRQILERHPGR